MLGLGWICTKQFLFFFHLQLANYLGRFPIPPFPLLYPLFKNLYSAPLFLKFSTPPSKEGGGGRLCESSLLYLIDICWPMVRYFYNLFLTYIRKPLPLIYTANSQIFRLSKWCSYWMTVWQGLHLKFDEAYI